MSSSPPAYDEAISQVKKLQRDGMTPGVKAKVYAAMAAKATASKSEIMEEVRKLARQAVETDKAFETIATKLAVVDGHEYLDKFGQPIKKYEPTWRKYQKAERLLHIRYTDLLWRSRSAATKTEAYLRDFTDTVIPLILEADSTYEENLEDLQAFIARPNPVNHDRQDDDFKKLKSDVDAFATHFSSFADDEGISLTTEVKDLTNSIASLKKDLASADTLVVEMGIALGVTALATGGGVILALTCLGPAAPATVITILIAGISAAIGEMATLIVAITKRNSAERDIGDQQLQLDEATRKLHGLGQVKAMLQRCADEGEEMFGRLESFSSIWDTVAQDASLIVKSSLANVHTDRCVKTRIQLIKASYSGLADALSDYATTIDHAELIALPEEVVGEVLSSAEILAEKGKKLGRWFD